MLQDIRYSLRLLRRSPGFSAVAILILALGIGANTAVFSVVNTLVLQPRQGRTDSLVAVFNRDRVKPADFTDFSYPAYVDLRDRSGVFESLAAHSFTTVGIRDGELTRQAFATIVSSNYFEALGVGLAAGRAFTAGEERPGATARVAIASYPVWGRRHFDPGFLGSTVRINGADFTIVGVTPRGFGGPFAFLSPQWYLPIGSYETITNAMFRARDTGLSDRQNHALNLMGALKPGVTMAAATPALDAFAASLGAQYPGSDRDRTFMVRPLPRMGVSSRPQSDGPLEAVAGLLALMAGLVLAVACLNLANLLLARGAARRKEMAVRQALGGGRARIVRQLVVEGMTLAVLGGAFGLLATWWTTTGLTAWLSSVVTFGVDFIAEPSIRLVGAAALFALAATVLFALGPAWSLSRPDVIDDLKLAPGRSGRRATSGAFLVVAQLAVSLALVVAGGLFARAAVNATTAEAGYKLERQIVVGLDPSLSGYDQARTRAQYATILERVRALPGIERASFASTVAFGDVQMGGRVRKAADAPDVESSFDIIGADYFETLGLRVLRGRGFTQTEEQRDSASHGALIDARLAAQLFGDADPIGRPVQLRIRGNDEPLIYTVVGIAPPLQHDLFESPPAPHIYVAYGSRFNTMMTLHARTASGMPETAALGEIRRELQAIDPAMAILWARTMTMQRDASISSWSVSAAAAMFSAFGLVALLLATIGVYGLKAYDVSRRTHEIGIRMALGATRGDVERLVMREGLRSTIVGLAMGLLLAAGVGKLLSGLLYRVSPFDPVVMTIAAAVLSAAALLACYLPARRATRVVPLDALRSE
ncbi:MAG: ADOP family duplicated permease [Vicinamibacterales bacterium]